MKVLVQVVGKNMLIECWDAQDSPTAIDWTVVSQTWTAFDPCTGSQNLHLLPILAFADITLSRTYPQIRKSWLHGPPRGISDFGETSNVPAVP